ncbi:MAG: lysozyme [Gluconacetobacter sp.]
MEMDSLAVADLLLRRLEGLRLAPYRDTAGLWTIGYGNRCLADGSPVTAATAPITEDAALALLTGTVAALRVKLRALVHVSLSACQEGAVLSWQYNVGTSAAASSTLLRLLNAGRFDGASAQFPVWNKIRDPKTGHLVVSQGLVNRREIERAAFLGRLPSPLQS